MQCRPYPSCHLLLLLLLPLLGAAGTGGHGSPGCGTEVPEPYRLGKNAIGRLRVPGQDEERLFHLHLPHSYHMDVPHRLIFVIHGYRRDPVAVVGEGGNCYGHA